MLPFSLFCQKPRGIFLRYLPWDPGVPPGVNHIALCGPPELGPTESLRVVQTKPAAIHQLQFRFPYPGPGHTGSLH